MRAKLHRFKSMMNMYCCFTHNCFAQLCFFSSLRLALLLFGIIVNEFVLEYVHAEPCRIEIIHLFHIH